MSETKAAVFLSYASQDSDAARRIASALRAEGVEVWFDESELRGGEVWDASIQRQIAECALFVAIVSAHTQARREGYFRLEWRLADERLRLMAEGTPFLLPVIVDATKERDALVPKSFLGVQWTWLPHGEVPPAFVARVQKLLGESGVAVPVAAVAVPASARPATAEVDSAVGVSTAERESAKSAARSRGTWLRLLPWALAGGAGAVALWLGLRSEARSVSLTAVAPAGLPVTRATIHLPANAPLAPMRVLPLGLAYSTIALSPDGATLVYVGLAGETSQLFKRPMDQDDVRPIPGTEGAYGVFFAPDSRWVGFFANDKLMKVDVTGGAPQPLCSSGKEINGACWADDGTIYFSDYPKLYRAGGRGEREVVTDSSGAAVLWTRSLATIPGIPVLLGSFIASDASLSGDFGTLYAYSLANHRRTAVVERAYCARIIPPRHLVFMRDGTLHAAGFDRDHLKPSEDAVPLISGVSTDAVWRVANYAVSSNGTLVYAVGPALHRSTPVWVKRDGTVSPPLMPARSYGELKLSPDGRRLAIVSLDVRDNLLIHDFETSKAAPLTEVGVNRKCVWMPDGQRLVFHSIRDDRSALYVKDLTDVNTAATLLFQPEDPIAGVWPHACSPDGRSLIVKVYWRDRRDHGKAHKLLLDDSPRLVPLDLPEDVEFMRFSPDGRWLSYMSGDTGRAEIYLRAFPDGRKSHQISFEGGEEVTWSTRSDELYFRNGNAWYVATLSFEPEFRATVRELFKGWYLQVMGYEYDISPDGQRFLMLKSEHPETLITQLEVITNWTEELKRRVPAGGGKGR